MIKNLLLFLVIAVTAPALNYSYPELGQTLLAPNNQYQLVRKLGEGAFGVVFEGVDGRGDSYALKWYSGYDELGDGSFLGLLSEPKREFLLGRSLEHPNILKSVDFFTIRDHEAEGSYTVLEYIAGKTLRGVPRQGLLMTDVVKEAHQFASALRYAYQQGYLHLDLHMNNVMLNQVKDLIVIDIASFFSFEEIADWEQSPVTYAHTNMAKVNKLQAFIQKHGDCFLAENQIKGTFTSGYIAAVFQDMIDICNELVARSELSKSQRLALKGRLTLLGWECQEDFEEGKRIDLGVYLDRLEELLDSL